MVVATIAVAVPLTDGLGVGVLAELLPMPASADGAVASVGTVLDAGGATCQLFSDDVMFVIVPGP